MIDLERRFADYKEHTDARIAILQSKISSMEIQSDNNTTEPGDEPCGYPCAEYINRIDQKVSVQELNF